MRNGVHQPNWYYAYFVLNNGTLDLSPYMPAAHTYIRKQLFIIYFQHVSYMQVYRIIRCILNHIEDGGVKYE